MGKRSAGAKNRIKWLRKAVVPTLKTVFQIAPEEYLRMIIEKEKRSWTTK